MKGNEEMIQKKTKLSNRAWITTIAVLLFSIVMSIFICAQHASSEAELRKYEESYRQSVSFTVTVTEPSLISTDLFLIESWVFDLFTKEEPLAFYEVSAAESEEERLSLITSGNAPFIEVSLAEYVKDVQLSLSRKIEKINAEASNAHNLIGVTSLSCDKQLLPENGCQITWKEGYDESIFVSEELLCIIPESMAEVYDNGKGETVLDFSNSGVVIVTMVDGKPVIEKKRSEYKCTIKIVGTYTGGDEESIYCPASIVQQVCGELGEKLWFRSLSATLADNSRLEEFREKMKICFIESSHNADETPWGHTLLSNIDGVSSTKHYEFYPYALDIKEEYLLDLSAILEESVKFNRMFTVIIVAVSVVTGFVLGFLMIHIRKRDILQMRSVGKSTHKIYLGWVLEHMICIILGASIGGAYNMWDPLDTLLIFTIVCVVGLSISLAIFMSKKLLSTSGEDE